MKMDADSWKQLADQKEKEWRSILETRINDLEKECREKDNQLTSERAKFNELKENFKYNLQLLEDRDKELEKYDVSTAELRALLNTKTAEVSEVQIHLDDLRNIIKREEKTREELQANYHRRLREKQAEIDAYKNLKDGEIENERKGYEDFRRNLQLQLIHVQSEVQTQKSELTTEFENAMKKREHEFRVQSDELNARALEHELKAKLLEKELELTRESNDKTAAAAEEAETVQRKLEKLVKQKDWELMNCTAVKDSLIAELQSKLAATEAACQKMQEDFQRKYTDMDKLVRDREDVTVRAKNGFLEREQALQAVTLDLQSQLEAAQIRERQLIWSNQDLLKEKEVQIEKLQEEMHDIKEKWSRHVAEISRENVARDLELGSALEEQRRLKLELEQRKDDMQRYRNELKVAVEKEEKLEKSKAQTELDWQRRCEDLERQQFDKAEDLIHKLTTARNEAQAVVKERERELQQKIMLVKSLQRERDKLRAVLKKHDISLDNFVKYSLDDAAEDTEMNYVEDLQEQNARLKELIAEMRSQMEILGQDTQKAESKPITYNMSVYEEEIKNLKQENRELKEKLKSSRKVVSNSDVHQTITHNEDVMSQLEGHTAVKNHINALNSDIGVLRSEKVELAATVKKQQARIAHLENSLEETSKQPRLKQIQIDQLIYEQQNCKRRHEAEVTGLKNRVGDLESQLSEARREADEYHRASLERNEELIALGNQLAALKLEISLSNPAINFGAQELYIQQLQDELAQLRKRAAAGFFEFDGISDKISSLGDNSSTADLKHKLRTAAAKIIQLARDNQQLTESNNRLRAELNTTNANKKIPDATSKGEHAVANGSVKSFAQVSGMIGETRPRLVTDRLQQLESLQYQLTKQELQFAHKFSQGAGYRSLKSAHSSTEDTQVPERDNSEVIVLKGTQKNNLLHANHVTMDVEAAQDPDPQMLVSFSSGGGDSIQQVWQMLEGSSPSASLSTTCSPTKLHHPAMPAQRKSAGSVAAMPYPGTKQIRRSDGGEDFQVEGHHAPVEFKPLRQPNAGISHSNRMKTQTRLKPKIRNYNVKDNPKR